MTGLSPYCIGKVSIHRPMCMIGVREMGTSNFLALIYSYEMLVNLKVV